MADRQKPGPKPRPGGPTKNRYVVKSGDPWWIWFIELSAHLDMTKADTIAAGLARLARESGFRDPPRRQD